MKIIVKILCLSLLGIGAAQSEVPVEQVKVYSQESGTDSSSLDEEVTRLKYSLSNSQKFQQELQREILELQEQLQKMLGKIEEQAYQIERLTDRQRNLYKDIDKRIVGLSEQLKSGNAAALTGQLAESGAGGPSARTVTDPEKENAALKAVNNAFELLREKKYKSAILAYKKFLSDFPQSSYVVNAHYWLGQIYYVLKSYKLAFASFDTVITQFPKSPKAADALLKQGNINMSDGKTADAKGKFEAVIKQYPDSPAAKLAQGELKKLGKK